MFTRWQKRKRKSPASEDARDIGGKPAQQQIADLGSITESATEAPAHHTFFWQRPIGQLAEMIKRALRRSKALNEGLAAERDRLPGM